MPHIAKSSIFPSVKGATPLYPAPKLAEKDVSKSNQDLDGHSNLHESLHPALVCYVKSRLYEDAGDMEKSQYFRQMYELTIRKFPDSRDPGGIIKQYFKF